MIALKPHYRDIGFVNTRAMFEKAYREGYAVPAYNFVTMEQLQAIIGACVKSGSPVILQISANVRKYGSREVTRCMARGALEHARALGSPIPVALNLDHGLSLEECAACIEDRFSSVMIDGSPLPYEDNVRVTKEVVEYAHRFDVSVEGELGVLSGVEESRYTDPRAVEDFVIRTGVDSLAVSVGTSHGMVKMKPGGPAPSLRFDILEEIARRLPGFPIVLHGASALPREYIDMINEAGGRIEEASGIPEDQVRRAAKSAVCKVNIASDGWVVLTAVVRKVLRENPSIIDPRKYLGAARDELERLYARKNAEVFGSAGKW